MTTEYECLGGPLDGQTYPIEDPDIGASYILEDTYLRVVPVHGAVAVSEARVRHCPYYLCSAGHLHDQGDA